MKLIYRIRRVLLSFYSSVRNKLVMIISGIHYGKEFRSCGSILYLRYDGDIRIGNYVNINSHMIADPIGGLDKSILVVCNGAKLTIGNRVGISNTVIYAREKITIDDDAVIGAGCKIYDNDFHSTIADYRLNGNTHIPSKPIYIGKRTFVGGHSIILKGVSIGDGAVIAAGSIVTKSVPENEIWGGNPAKFIKKINSVNK